MGKFRIKTAVILFTTLIGIGVVLYPFHPANAANADPNTQSKQDSLTIKDTNLITPQDGSFGNTELFVKMMLSVLLVGVLGIAAVYISRRLLPKLTNLSGRRIKVVETIHLGPRRALYLIEIDSQCMLVGSTNDRITKIADIGGPKTDFSTAYNERIEGADND